MSAQSKLPRSRTAPALLREMAERFPNNDVVTDATRRLTYRELLREATELGKAFHALGIRKDDKVAILLGNQVEWLVIAFAALSLGAVVVALNTWWRKRELEYALRTSDASVLLMIDQYGGNDYLTAVGEMLEGQAELPRLRTVVCLGERQSKHVMSFEGLLTYARNVEDAVVHQAVARVSPQDTAYLLFTSGSTAHPKLARLAHRGLVENMHPIGERMHLTDQDRVLLVVSMFWSFACVNALFATMTHGASVILQYQYDAGDALRLIEEERCTAVYTQPIIVMGLYNHADRAKRDLRTWRTGICRPNVLHLVEEMGAHEMISAYGLTECYGNSCTSDGHWPIERRRLGCGIALPGVTIEIVDLVTRDLVPDGTVGEIRVGGNVTPGYYNDPQRTAEAIDASGRFLTGDLGRIEEHGFLQFCGRVKELIKTGGMNVSPAEVEEVLQEHPAVMHAVVVGIADRERDEIVAAMIALRDGSHATPEGLIAYCRPLLASYKVPRYLEIVAAEAIPLTDTRKISKRIVAEQLAARYLGMGAKR